MKNSATKSCILAYNQILKECDTIYHEAAVRAGVSDCAFWILYALQDSDHTLTQSEIGNNASMPRQTVNSALKKLEKDGFLTLRKIEGKMGKSIHLTRRGEQFVRQHILPVAAAEERACAQFSEEEQRAFLATFRALADRLKEEIMTIEPEAT